LAGDHVDMNASDHHGMRHRRLAHLESLCLGQFEFDIEGILRRRVIRYEAIMTFREMENYRVFKERRVHDTRCLIGEFPDIASKEYWYTSFDHLRKKLIKEISERKKRAFTTTDFMFSISVLTSLWV
jgi:hypothetical protein